MESGFFHVPYLGVRFRCFQVKVTSTGRLARRSSSYCFRRRLRPLRRRLHTHHYTHGEYAVNSFEYEFVRSITVRAVVGKPRGSIYLPITVRSSLAI